MRFRVIGLDPGIYSFAYSVIELDELTLQWSILDAGLLINPIDKMTNLPKQIPLFLMEVQTLLGNWRPDFVAIERYINKGRISAAMNEKCNVQIGIIVAEALKIGAKIGVPTAAEWKNDYTRNSINGNDIYNAARKNIRDSLKGIKPKIEYHRFEQRYGRFVFKKRKQLTPKSRTSDLAKEMQAMVPHTSDASMIGLRHAIRSLNLQRKMKMIVHQDLLIKHLTQALLRRVGK